MESVSIIDALKVTPSTLRSAIRRLKGDEIARLPNVGEWSALDLVRHVRAADAILAPRVYQVLVRGQAPLPAFDERAWAELIAAANVPVDAQLAAFAIQRAELTALLRTLSEEQWQRAGMHEEAGEQTVRDICEKIVEHEREHAAQLDAIITSFRT